MRKISLEKIDSLFSAIAENNALYMPVDTKTGAKYEKMGNGKKLSDSLNTVRSAKWISSSPKPKILWILR